jgi:hypothetical protein
MEIIHETKNATPLVNGSAVPHGMLRHTAACCGKFAAVCRSNRAQLDFSGMGPAATRGTARNVNAPVEIAGFDFSGTALTMNSGNFLSVLLRRTFCTLKAADVEVRVV